MNTVNLLKPRKALNKDFIIVKICEEDLRYGVILEGSISKTNICWELTLINHLYGYIKN